MAEASGSNAADAGSRSAAKGDDATRGRPYYEQLRKDLRGTIERKRELDRNLATIENTIAGLENKYLEETNTAGNIIKGFDNYIKASTSATASSSGPGTATRRKGGVSDQDRIFSRSSVSWADSPPLSLNLGVTNHNSSKNPMDSAGIASATGSARDTPTGGFNKASTKTKKKAAVEKEDVDGDERPSKRGKVSWAPKDS